MQKFVAGAICGLCGQPPLVAVVVGRTRLCGPCYDKAEVIRLAAIQEMVEKLED